MKRFIDDIASEVIEAKLISPLGNIFEPVAVSAMSADLVTSMAGESEENRAQREQLTKQLDVLTKGSDTCKRFIGVRLLSKTRPYFVLVQWLLISWVGADDGATQSDLEFDNDSVSDSSSGSDEGSELSFESDTPPAISLGRLDP